MGITSIQGTMKTHRIKALGLFKAFSRKSSILDGKRKIKQHHKKAFPDSSDRQSFESSSTSNSMFSTRSGVNSIASTDGIIKPEMPNGWEIRYDPVLSEYYYLNKKQGIVQFDSPLEVVRHIDI
ncbi:hypothetical protein BRETT_004904 [Brettanomyces bruxellensis]|uniref:WW domain-containing protein n=1 Tax=Dekkera bruxellensis TaxID=5007 RepID=A0A871RDS1_DEKBR|nr:uncharacterized protein BRETT_004904 [Brettanomyces bruxellensis]QOU20250.1 hypothetical protein BRETT_004904 [Brettanomyces bruxellensis]